MRLICLTAVTILGDVLFFATRPAFAADALWIQPSGNWFGIDGDWSSFGFGVGVPTQYVELTVSTTLSEIWVVENTGCSPNILCHTARGGVFDIKASRGWQSLGPWQLGLKDLPYGGDGDYGLDTITFANSITSTSTKVDAALIAGFNDTDYYQGFLGVGVTQGRFGRNVTNPFISQLSETYGFVPSHSYGYTAGANYAGKVPASLTFGGYDILRYKPHDMTFRLNPDTRVPSVNLRGITAAVTSLDKAPLPNWTSTSQPLLSMNDSVSAIIDSSTPYLWLPQSVCDRFAAYLNLKWNETLGVYVFSNGVQYTNYLEDSPLSFTFSLSSYDYLDNFGKPLELPSVVNVTIPAAAFAHLLRYPFRNAIRFNDSSVPYFPLKRAQEGGPYIIGRVFMQAAYLIVNYDKTEFSVHEALFPQNPSSNYSLVNIARTPNSPYPAYVDKGSDGLTTAQMAGIAVGAFATGSIVGLTFWCCCRRRRRTARKLNEQGEGDKEDAESVEADLPRSPVRNMLSIITRRKKSKKPVVHEVHGSNAQPVEVAADVNHEVYELPAALEPVELDVNNNRSDEVTEFGTGGTHSLSAYELARRKLHRQLQGPVPTYEPPSAEKSALDVSPVAHYRPADEPSPTSPATYSDSSSLPYSLPSPITPHADWTSRHFDLPSPMTVAPPMPSPYHLPWTNSDPSITCSIHSPNSPDSPNSPKSSAQYPLLPRPLQSTLSHPTFDLPPTLSRSNSSNSSPVSPVGSMPPPPPSYQRTPIDPSRVICLGSLPENVQLPHHQPSIIVPRLIVTPAGRTIAPRLLAVSPPQSPSPPGSPSSDDHLRRHSTSTLGSNYTVEEEYRIRNEMTMTLQEDSFDSVARQRQQQQQQQQQQRQPQQYNEEHQSDDFPCSPHSMERIDAGSELVHVPQLAEKRYSWEEDLDFR